ncbi:MAG TPA: hypothetical protein VFX17_03110 [Patescibacteria group bacterium]|nr:hypothetical protein [Patescibacteria group bacterium]
MEKGDAMEDSRLLEVLLGVAALVVIGVQAANPLYSKYFAEAGIAAILLVLLAIVLMGRGACLQDRMEVKRRTRDR